MSSVETDLQRTLYVLMEHHGPSLVVKAMMHAMDRTIHELAVNGDIKEAKVYAAMINSFANS